MIVAIDLVLACIPHTLLIHAYTTTTGVDGLGFVNAAECSSAESRVVQYRFSIVYKRGSLARILGLPRSTQT